MNLLPTGTLLSSSDPGKISEDVSDKTNAYITSRLNNPSSKYSISGGFVTASSFAFSDTQNTGIFKEYSSRKRAEMEKEGSFQMRLEKM